MIPIYQQSHINPGEPGDCLRACTASILELPIEKVPHWIKEYPGWSSDPKTYEDFKNVVENGNHFEWQKPMMEFCKKRGYIVIYSTYIYNRSKYNINVSKFYNENKELEAHATVANYTKIIFDPQGKFAKNKKSFLESNYWFRINFYPTFTKRIKNVIRLLNSFTIR